MGLMIRATIAALLVGFLVAACGKGSDRRVAVPDDSGRMKTPASARADRRAYDGAPPVIPHPPFGASCVSCHTTGGIEVPGVGFAPPSPHENTDGMSAISRCTQCHVFRETDGEFAASSFSGLKQDLRRGRRLNDLAPPVIPHQTFMRENCLACHSGPAAREEIRTPHPERTRCTQCHVEARTTSSFVPGGQGVSLDRAGSP